MMIWNKHLKFKDFNNRIIQKFVIPKKKEVITLKYVYYGCNETTLLGKLIASLNTIIQ